MDFRTPPQPGQRGLFVAVNQDASCLCLATARGARVFSLESFKECLDLQLGALSIAKLLYCTSLLAFVGAGEQPHLSPRKLVLLNTHSNSVIQSLPFPSTVLAVHLNRKRLVVVLEHRVFVYALESLELLCTLDTPPNPRGVAALTPCSVPCLLALPGQARGSVRVHDTLAGGSSGALCEIAAHKSALALLGWNQDGSLLASASQRGTVVRVHPMRSHGTAGGFTLRRGTTPAAITGLAFSPAGVQPPLLAVASDHGTVHLWRLAQQPDRHPAAAAASQLLAAVVPAGLSSAVEPQRPLATVRLPGKGGHAAVCALREEAGEEGGRGGAGATPGPSGQADALQLVVATAEGILYSYRIEGLARSGSGPGSGGGAGVRSMLQGEWRLLPGS